MNHQANCPSILAVSAVDHQYRIADFSCDGSRKKGNQVNITTPGVDIISCAKKGYDVLSETSMATPFVAVQHGGTVVGEVSECYGCYLEEAGGWYAGVGFADE